MDKLLTGLSLSDMALNQMICFAQRKVAPEDVSGSNGVLENHISQADLEQHMDTGEDIYAVWKQMEEAATQQAQSCTSLYEESSQRMIDLENQKNHCYLESDQLQEQKNNMEAKEAGLSRQMEQATEDLANLEREMVDLSRKIRKLEHDQKVFNILRWIPSVGWITEIIRVVEDVRGQLNRKKRQAESQERALVTLRQEWDECASQMRQLEQKIQEVDHERSRLDREINLCQAQRDQAAKEMIDWKNREQYYLTMVQKIESLISHQEPVEEFYRLIADNPPTFPLAV